MFELEMFPARDGDCLVLRWGPEDATHRMLIDAGRESCWPALKRAFGALSDDERDFELLVVTHIDADHIAGVLKMLTDPMRAVRFKEVWFNAYHHLVGGDWESFGVKQGEALSDVLAQWPSNWNTRFGKQAVVVEDMSELPSFKIEGLKITLLSPTRQKLQVLAAVWKTWLTAEGLDRNLQPDAEPGLPAIIREGYEAFGPQPDVLALAASPARVEVEPPNGSSIAFIAEYDGRRVLLAADAHHDTLASALARLPENERRVDLFKLSHHGSQGNLSRPLADLLDCRRFVISTDGSRHHHPDPEAIARLLLWKPGPKEFYFNYRHEEAAVWDNDVLKQDYDYRCIFPQDENMGRLKVTVA